MPLEIVHARPTADSPPSSTCTGVFIIEHHLGNLGSSIRQATQSDREEFLACPASVQVQDVVLFEDEHRRGGRFGGARADG
jgi:hypothetical protein